MDAIVTDGYYCPTGASVVSKGGALPPCPDPPVVDPNTPCPPVVDELVPKIVDADLDDC